MNPRSTIPALLGIAVSLLGGSACSSSSEGPLPGDAGTHVPAAMDASHAADGSAPGTIKGTVQGYAFSTVGSAWWIVMPGAGSPPVMVFVSDAVLTCAELSNPGWDKVIGDHQLLEMAAPSTAPAAYRIGTEADANYVRGAYNPTADGVTVTIESAKPAESVTGSFDLTFAGESLRGSFIARWCAAGMEP
jgi:hypothetical protein